MGAAVEGRVVQRLVHAARVVEDEDEFEVVEQAQLLAEEAADLVLADQLLQHLLRYRHLLVLHLWLAHFSFFSLDLFIFLFIFFYNLDGLILLNNLSFNIIKLKKNVELV